MLGIIYTLLTCEFAHCKNPPKARGLCGGHYRQAQLGKELSELRPGRNAPLEDRLAYWSMPLVETGCVVWLGTLTESGHSKIGVGYDQKRAHRVAWELVNGPIPDGLMIDHRCGVRPCINVDHLRLATPAQNSAHLTVMDSRNTSGHRNVFWDKSRGKWMVLIGFDGRYRNFGRFSDKADAIRVANEKREELYGEFSGRSS